MVGQDQLFDPFTLRTILSIVAGAVTGLVVVRLTFFLHNQRDLFKSIRAIRSELEYDDEQLAKLTGVLRDDMQRQHVDLPIEVPRGTTIEIRYVLSLPGALTTSSFEQLRQSGRLLELPPEVRRALFELYDALDRINRLRQYRETLQYNNVENLHVVVDAADVDVEPGGTAHEEDFPPEVRRQLADLRRLRRGTRGINTSILRLVAAVSAPERVEELDLGEYAGRGTDHGPETPTIEAVIARLDEIERDSFWSRFV